MFIWSSSSAQTPSDLSQRLRRIEAKLDRILTHLDIRIDDIADDPGLNPMVRELAEKGRKIEAIRAYREETGSGLKEAKDAVDAFLGR